MMLELVFPPDCIIFDPESFSVDKFPRSLLTSCRHLISCIVTAQALLELTAYAHVDLLSEIILDDIHTPHAQGSGATSPQSQSGAGRPYSEVTAAVLPSSLTRVLPITLVFSTRAPESVCGTGAYSKGSGFSSQPGSIESVA